MRRIVYLTSLILVITFIAPLKTQAVIETRPDFDRDRKAAVEYGNERSKEFIDRLNRGEKEILDKNVKDSRMFTAINSTIRELRVLDYSVNDLVSKIDSLFQKAEKTSETRFVYLYKNGTQLGMSNNQDLIDNKNINMANFNILRETLEYGIHSEFIQGDLVRNNIQSDQSIIVRLRIPTNTKLLYTGDSQVVLERNKGIRITNWRLAAEGGRQVIVADADVVSKDRVVEINKRSNENINNDLRAALEKVGVEYRGDIVNFDFRSIWSGFAQDKAKEVINYMIDVIPNDLLRDLFQSTSGNIAPIIKINFFDKQMSSSPMENFHGRYNPRTRVIDYNITNIFGVDTDKECLHRRTMIHEVGHAVDEQLLVQGEAKIPLSQTAEFVELFQRESNNLTEETSKIINGKPYGQTNSPEFFAEVFSAMKSSNENLRNLIWVQVPETCKFIQEMIIEYRIKNTTILLSDTSYISVV